jgi:hypothetical protein
MKSCNNIFHNFITFKFTLSEFLDSFSKYASISINSTKLQGDLQLTL